MDLAWQQAWDGLGWVNPNPLVGAVIVKDGQVLAKGYHTRYRQLHAEREAFLAADKQQICCQGATMYVTLEPCCHHGHQPPCTEAILQHGISRVVMGLKDPNPLVAGQGVALLREAGVQVDILEDDALPACCEMLSRLRYQNRVFLKFITAKRPWVLAKWAMTLDGKIATYTGDSKWVTGEKARQQVHRTRSEYQAILCGIGTVLADNPLLNCRLEGTHRQPIRMVADHHLRIPLDSQLVKTAHTYRTIVVHALGADAEKAEQLHAAGVELWCCNTLDDMLCRAGNEKIDSILLEGGGTLNESFFQADLVDEVAVYIAPKIVGGAQAKTPVEGTGVGIMADALKWHDLQVEHFGDDMLVRAFRRPLSLS